MTNPRPNSTMNSFDVRYSSYKFQISRVVACSYATGITIEESRHGEDLVFKCISFLLECRYVWADADETFCNLAQVAFSVRIKQELTMYRINESVCIKHSTILIVQTPQKLYIYRKKIFYVSRIIVSKWHHANYI